jgi:hypothetical protein
MGAPSVERVMVWTEVANGVIFRVMVEELKPSVGNGGEITSVTGIVTTGSPVTVIVTVDVYVDAGRLVGFTRTLRVAGRLPLLGSTVIHASVPGVVAVKAGVPELAFTEMVWTAGSLAAPI